MKKLLHIIFGSVVFLTATMCSLQAQKIKRYNTFSYNVNDGLLQSHVNDIAFDKNNFCWLSFENGIQKFDGNQFAVVDVQPGLPDDKAVKFLQSTNGSLFISHADGISKYNIDGDKFIQIYSTPPGNKYQPVFLGADEGIIYIYTPGAITGFYEASGRRAGSVAVAFFAGSKIATKIKSSGNVAGHRVCIVTDSSFILWDLKAGKQVAQRPQNTGYFLSDYFLKNDHELLYFSRDKAYSIAETLYDFTTGKTIDTAVKVQVPGKPFRANYYTSGDVQLSSLYNHLYETNKPGGKPVAELVNMQNKPAGGNAVIFKLSHDNYGNLYLLTVNDGFRKLIKNNYPVKYYGTDNREENFITSLCADKTANRIIAGAYGNGLLIFDTLQQLVKHITVLPDNTTHFSPSGIVKTSIDSYLIFCWAQPYAWHVSNNFTYFSKVFYSCAAGRRQDYINYYGNVTLANGRPAYFQTSNNFYSLVPGQNAKYYDAGDGIATGSVLVNGKLVTFSEDELIFIDTATFSVIHRSPLTNTGGVRCLAADKAGNIYIGSNKGVYKTDAAGKVLQYMNKFNGLPDECIYAVAPDNEGHVWCSSNRGIFSLGSKDILHLKKEDGLQENEFNSNVVDVAEDGELFFGGVNGISSFFPSAIKNFEEKISIFVTSVKVNNKPYKPDTAAWQVKEIRLPYDKNALSFDFIAMANNNPAQYIYQYQMEGIDEQWIQNNAFQTVRYHLQPGRYIFKIAAARYFNKAAAASQEIIIIIYAPFWRTWWFVSLLLLVAVSITAYSIINYNQRQQRKRLAVIENEKHLHQERERISRDLHDNIGAYANAVLYNTELLEKEQNAAVKNELMGDLKFASKEIITSLRETIWAFKKDSYAADECLLRIRNFVQALARYYPHITFSVTGEAPGNTHLQNAVALNLVRIVQEAVTNAIKHAGTQSILISNTILPGKWCLAIADNGKGFIGLPANGDGLQNMQQRALAAGFSIKIDSVPGSGTSITLAIKT